MQSILTLLLTLSLLTLTSAKATIVFSDDFESPAVTVAQSGSATTSQIRDGVKWVGASAGFNANRNGIENEGSGQFTDPTGSQAYAFRYTNSGVTSAEGQIGALSLGVNYTVSFDVVLDGFNNGDDFNVQLLAYNIGDARNDARSPTPGVILASLSGNDVATSTYQSYSFTFTADAVTNAAEIGLDLAVRFDGSTDSANWDNVVIEATPIPEPSSLLLLALGGLGLLTHRRRR